MKLRTLLIIGAASLLLGLLALIPARLIESPFNNQLMPRAQLNATQGTIWLGSGLLQVDSAAIPVSWRFSPLSLLQLSLGWRFHLEGNALQGEATAARTFAGWKFSNVDLRASAPMLSRLALPITIANPQGEIHLQTAELILRDSRLQGEANLLWQKAAIAQWPALAQAEYALRINGTGEKVSYILETRKGDLKMTGQGEWTATTGFDFKGAIEPPKNIPPDIASLLAMIGRPNAEGRYLIDYRGR